MMRNIRTTGCDAQGHVLLVYESQAERLAMLTDCIKEGLAAGELCIFVTPDSSEKVIDDFLSQGFDVRAAIDHKDFRIFEMKATYLPHGNFVVDHMLTNVLNYTLDARQNGYSGLRTAGEMSWLHDQPEFMDAAERYEKHINELCDTDPAFTGLCLYPVRKGLGEILESALQTHPSIIYDGTTRANPFVSPA